MAIPEAYRELGVPWQGQPTCTVGAPPDYLFSVALEKLLELLSQHLLQVI